MDQSQTESMQQSEAASTAYVHVQAFVHAAGGQHLEVCRAGGTKSNEGGSNSIAEGHTATGGHDWHAAGAVVVTTTDCRPFCCICQVAAHASCARLQPPLGMQSMLLINELLTG